MDIDRNKIEMRVLDYQTAKKIIVENHYSKTMPCCELALGFYIENVLNCVILFGQSASSRMAKSLPSEKYWELTRLFSFDWSGKGTESCCIGKALKYVGQNYDKDLIVSFADPSHGHAGYIYQATNWLYCGVSDKAGNTIYEIDGQPVHSRSILAKYGTTIKEIVLPLLQKDHPDSTITIGRFTQKHRYIYLFGSHKKKKELLAKLKYPVLPYPKLTGEVSRAIRPASSGEGLVQFQQPAFPTEDLIGIIRSNKFAKILQSILPQGESIPVKTGKKGTIPAFAKTDEGFQVLLNHKDEKVRNLVQARLATKSWPTHIKKVNGMVNQAKAWGNKIAVPLRYYGAHTGRLSGTEGINLHNLPGAGRAGSGTNPLLSKIRHLLLPSPGHVLAIVDLAQIEARVLAWFAGQDDLLKGFANGEDIYSEFATTLFGCPVRKANKSDSPDVSKLLTIKRGFGKDAILGCIAEDTPILTNNGWKSIQNVTKNDMLWDGKEWVGNAGIAEKGKQVCVNVRGVWLTPTHAVINSQKWCLAIHLATNSPVSEINLGNSQSYLLNLEREVGLSPSNVAAPVVEQLLRQETIWSRENLHAVMSVLKVPLVEVSRLFPNFVDYPAMSVWLKEFVASLKDATMLSASLITDTVGEVLEYGPIGSRIERVLLDTLCLYLDGIAPNLKLTALTTIEDTNRAILDLQHSNSKLETRNVICYDILNVGPHKRYQVSGFIGENCGYGMGDIKFFNRCLANSDLKPHFESGEYNFDFIRSLIKTYRTKYAMIPKFWRDIEKAFRWVTKYPTEQITTKLFTFWNEHGTVNVQLPSGRILRYPHVRIRKSDNTLMWQYGHLWGGSITENLDQAVSRDILVDAILRIENAGYPVILHVHDETVCNVSEKDADNVLKKLVKLMCVVPSWATGLPIAAEAKTTTRYEK